MNQILVNRSCDELQEFRIRQTENSFISNIKFVSTQCLSRARVSDISLVYDGPKTNDLIHLLLPNFTTNQLDDESASSIKPSTKSTLSIPENCQTVDILLNGQNTTCLKFQDILQIANESKNIYALCPYGCDPEEKLTKALKMVNPMKLHRYDLSQNFSNMIIYIS